jgi:hypothetical protein
MDTDGHGMDTDGHGPECRVHVLRVFQLGQSLSACRPYLAAGFFSVDFFSAGISIFETVISLPFASPVSAT